MMLAAAMLALAAGAVDAACAVGNAVPSQVIHGDASANDGGGLGKAADELRRGRTSEAKAILMRGVSGAANPGAEAASLLALAHAADGEPRQAASWARQALSDRSATDRATAHASLNAAFALAESGDASATRAALQAAARSATQSGDTAIIAAASVNLALLESRVGGDPRAAAAKAYETVRRIEAPARRASLLTAIALALTPEQGTPVGGGEVLAAEILGAAYRAADEARDARLLAHALGLMGELQLRTGHPELARASLLRADAAARAAPEEPWRFRWLWLLGLAKRDLGDPTALATLEEAVALLETEKARRSFAAFASVTLARDYGRVYRDLTDTLLVAAAKGAPAESETHVRRARDVLELSHTAEIEDFFRDPCIARRASDARREASDVAYIYPIVLADRTEILVATGRRLRRFSSSRGGTEVAREVRRLRVALEPPGTPGYRQSAARLHDWLVRPIEAHLLESGVKTLVWIPDGPLRGLPWGALHDGRAFLIEKYNLTVTPLASFATGSPRPARMSAAVTGLSVSRQGFPALPGVGTELDALSKLLATPVLRDEAFTATALRATIEKRPVNMIHVASHGQFAPEPGETFVLTYDGRLTLPQLRRALTAGQLREEPIELLTLSACQTAAGDDRSALGLAGVAIGAGARSVLATLWSVGDESTARLVTRFYERLIARETSKAGALRDSQLELMKDPRFSHPAYWAPYLLIGNWN